MKKIRSWVSNMKDVIAFMLVGTFCIAIFLPIHLVDKETMQVFERILFSVLGFYFGFHSGELHKTDINTDMDNTDN